MPGSSRHYLLGLAAWASAIHADTAMRPALLPCLPRASCARPSTRATHLSSTVPFAFNRDVFPADRVPVETPPALRQQMLSQALDRAAFQQLSAVGPGRESFRAHLQLRRQPGAGAWLHAPPADTSHPRSDGHTCRADGHTCRNYVSTIPQHRNMRLLPCVPKLQGVK